MFVSGRVGKALELLDGKTAGDCRELALLELLGLFRLVQGHINGPQVPPSTLEPAQLRVGLLDHYIESAQRFLFRVMVAILEQERMAELDLLDADVLMIRRKR